jgi:hypothetical protein
MKKVITLAFLIMTTTVFACPELSGTFECFDEEQGQYYDMVITQKGSGVNTVYRVKDYDGIQVVKANNQWVDVIEDGVAMKMKTYCSDNQLNLLMNGKVQTVGQVDVHAIIGLDSANNLFTFTQTTVNDQSYPVEESSCTRY